MVSDTICVSWRDVFLRCSDLQTLDRAEWVGDNVLTFHAEWLASTSTAEPLGVRMWSPSLVELLCSLPDAESTKQVVPELNEQFLLLPVSDRYWDGVGSHWSLLLVDIAHRRAIHFDSLMDANLGAATRVTNAIFSLVEPHGKVDFETAESLARQQNGSDCGIYVLALSHSLQRLLDSNLKNLNKESSPNLLDQVIEEATVGCTPQKVSDFRDSYRGWLGRWSKRSENQSMQELRSVRDIREAIGDFCD